MLKRIWNRLVRCFVVGVLAVLPLVITGAILIWVNGFLQGIFGADTLLGGLLAKLGLNFVDNSAFAYAIGWVFVLAFIFALGLLLQTGLKKYFNKMLDGILKRVPLVGKVYDASRQVVDMMDKGASNELKGMSVVYCAFGEKGGAGVLALLPTPQPVPINGRDHNVVLVPQSPVPIGGGLLFVPSDSVEKVDMSVDVFMSIYVSMGVTVPQHMKHDTKAIDAASESTDLPESSDEAES